MYLSTKSKSKLYIFLLTNYTVYYVVIEPGQLSPPMFSILFDYWIQCFFVVVFFFSLIIAEKFGSDAAYNLKSN